MKCWKCKGEGVYLASRWFQKKIWKVWRICEQCDGDGVIGEPEKK